MKELSMKEKAEAYDKSLERAKSVIEQNPLMEYLKKGIEYIFPELKESKVENVDEKVRKALIKLVTNHASMDLFIEYDIHLDEALAWLEKQGEKSSDKIVEKARTEKQRVLLTETDGSANIGWDCRSLQDVKLLLEYGLDYIKKLEKQSEQKSTDKVEPKFKEGEWITNGDYTWKIVEVKPLDYILQSQNSNIVDDTISHVDEQFHSFTLEDAKDGDVLQLGKVTAIFKEFIGNECCRCYCSVCNGEFEIPSQDGADNSYGCHNAIPATKEQCDLLFQKMREMGYEFDTDKKELKRF